MYLIINNEEVRKFHKSPVIVGTSDSCDVKVAEMGIAKEHFQLERLRDEIWTASPLTAFPVYVNSRRINKPTGVTGADQIRIGTTNFQVRYATDSTAVVESLDEKNFEIQSMLHKRILEDIKRSSAELSEDEYRDKIEFGLEDAIGKLKINADLESYLSTKALRKILLDQIDELSGRKSSVAYKKIVAQDFDRYKHLAQRLETIIGLTDGESPQEKVERIETLLPWAMKKLGGVLPPIARKELSLALIKVQLLDIIFGLGPLEDLMSIPDINDIMVLPSGKIYVERRGAMRDTGRRMLTPAVSVRIVERIVGREGRRLDLGSPMVDARITDGSRLNAVIEPISLNGPALTIRRFAAKPFSISDLVDRGMLTRTVANFLQACVLARKNLIISGGTGSGKTTMLNALASYVSVNERIITVEDTAEIKLTQPHVVSLQAKPPNLEGRNAITIRDLVKNALRMRPDRILVGECRGSETLDMLQAMNTGHDGSFTTVHANSPIDAMRRLEVMTMQTEDMDLSGRAIREQIASAVDIVVQVDRVKEGRRVVSICEVVEFDEENGAIIVEEIFSFRRRLRQKQIVSLSRGELAFSGYVPSFIDELIATKVVSVESMF